MAAKLSNLQNQVCPLLKRSLGSRIITLDFIISRINKTKLVNMNMIVVKQFLPKIKKTIFTKESI